MVEPTPPAVDPAADPSDAFLRRVLAASPDCIQVLDLDGRLVSMTDAGRAALEIDDLTPYLGTCWTDGWRVSDRDAATAAVAAAVGGGTGRFEARADTAKGAAKWWDVTVSPIPGPDGRPERLLSVSRDVTDRHAAADVAAERLDRLRSVVESARDYAVISVDTDGVIVGWSTGAAETFGHAERDAVGQMFNLIWTPEDLAHGSPGHELAVAREAGVAPDNRWHLRADGRRIFVTGATRPVRNAAGDLSGYVKVCRDETDRRAAEQAAADARLRSDAALTAGAVATYTWDILADRVYGDESLRRLFGLHLDETGSAPLADYVAAIHPDDRGPTSDAIGRAVASGGAFEAEYRVVAEGRERWVVARGRVERDDAGRAVRFPGAIVDVTDAKAAAADRDRLAEQRRLALDAADLGWWQVDAASGDAIYDDRFAAIFDVPGRRAPYAEVFARIHPDDRGWVGQAIAAATTGPEQAPRYAAEYRVVHGDGSVRWVRARGQTSYAGTGADRGYTRFVGTMQDVTSERAAGDALRAEQEQLRTIFDQAPDDAILVMDVDRVLTAWNPAAERITGWSAAEAVGQTADIIFTPEDRAAGGAEQETDVAARDGKAVDERWHVRKDASRFWGSGTMNALHAADGSVRGFLKVFRDATARHVERETLAFLGRVTDAVMGEGDPERIIGTVERLLGEHLGASRIVFAEATDDGQQVVIRHEWAPGLPSIIGTHRPADFGQAVVAAFAAGRTHVSRDADREFPAGAGLEAIRAIGAMSGISVPILDAGTGRLKVLVVVHHAVPRDWTAAEVGVVRQVADRMVAEVERARAGRAVTASEASYRELADAMPAIVWGAGPDGVIDYYNRRWHEYTGRPAGAAGQDMWGPVVHPDEEARIAVEWGAAARTGATFEMEQRYRRGSDGTYRWHLVRGLPVRGVDGRVVRWIGTSTDVHDQRLAAAELRATTDALARQGRFLDAALSAVSDFTYTFDRAGRFVFVSKPLLDLWGMTLGQAVGRNFHDLPYEPELAERLQRQVEEVYQTRRTLTDQTEYTGPTGESGTFEYTFAPVLAPDGTVEVVAGVSRNMTERVRFEREREHLLQAERAARAQAEASAAQAEQAGRMKDEFLATLSHELRTPLNAIVGWTGILRAPGTGPGDYAEGLAVIDRNARAQTQIIEDILDMSRIISGKLRLDVQRVDLSNLVRAGVDTVQPAADAKGVRLQVVLDPAAGPVSGDPNRLHQVFWNLLSNAVKFTPKGGRVQVLLERVNSHVEVSVVDTGEGIDPGFLPHVFDRFRQADASTTRRHGGLGLGLAIVKQLVELHGGSVRVKSPGKGQGATFIVALPLTVLHADPAEPAGPREHPAAEVSTDAHRVACDQLRGIRVVAVDDEPDGRAIVKRLLEDCGATVRTAGSAAEALALIGAEVPTVLVSDVGMPGEDGYGLIRRVRALPGPAGSVPAAALTAYARAADRVRALEAGFQMHLAKPVDPAELVVTVAALARMGR